jgi:HTH-type transcriptional regulator, cell division transcriptional repressor
MTQAELAARLQVIGVEIDRAGVSKWEAGLREVSDYELIALAEALAVEVLWLLEGAAPLSEVKQRARRGSGR